MKKSMKSSTLYGHTKRVYFEEEQVDHQGKVSKKIKFYNRISEPAYFKVYKEGRSIFAQLDFAPTGLVFDLIFLANYPAGDEAGIGGTIDLNSRVKKELMADNNLKKSRFYEILTKMTEIGFLVRIDQGSYQINPMICSRGVWKDVGSAYDGFRERCIEAETTKAKATTQP